MFNNDFFSFTDTRQVKHLDMSVLPKKKHKEKMSETVILDFRIAKQQDENDNGRLTKRCRLENHNHDEKTDDWNFKAFTPWRPVSTTSKQLTLFNPKLKDGIIKKRPLSSKNLEYHLAGFQRVRTHPYFNNLIKWSLMLHGLDFADTLKNICRDFYSLFVVQKHVWYLLRFSIVPVCYRTLHISALGDGDWHSVLTSQLDCHMHDKVLISSSYYSRTKNWHCNRLKKCPRTSQFKDWILCTVCKSLICCMHMDDCYVCGVIACCYTSDSRQCLSMCGEPGCPYVDKEVCPKCVCEHFDNSDLD
jgi:hypothetical protein